MAELIGKIVANRYRVDTLLGRGAMGVVYKVWDTERTVSLAMKVLNEDRAEDKVFLRRFEREARVLSELQHPHIVRCYGMERDGGIVYILMDYIEGETVSKLISETFKPLSREAIINKRPTKASSETQ